MEELQKERTAGEKHSIALATQYLKPEHKVHPPFFMHDMARGSFLISPAVCRWCQRQAGPPSFLTACCAPGGGPTGCTIRHPLPGPWLPAAQQGLPQHPPPTWAQACNVFYHGFCQNCTVEILSIVLLTPTVQHVQLLMLPAFFLCSPMYLMSFFRCFRDFWFLGKDLWKYTIISCTVYRRVALSDPVAVS